MPIVLETLKQKPLEGIVLNVNIPNVASRDQIKGVKRTRQGYSGWNDWFKEKPAQDGRRRFEIHGDVNLIDKEVEFDTLAMRYGFLLCLLLLYSILIVPAVPASWPSPLSAFTSTSPTSRTTASSTTPSTRGPFSIELLGLPSIS